MIKAEIIKTAISEIASITGPDYVTDKDFHKAAYSRNVESAFPDRWADLIVRPKSTEEVSAIVKIANKYKIPITPRGGGADLVGGSTTDTGILMDLTRMNKVLEVYEEDFFVVVECGITWGKMLSELQKYNLTTGIIGPGSGFSATIGGGLSNATAGGGSTKYGLVPDICLGVEVVIGNGDIIKTGAWANRYAKPHCRYGVAPDFTGLFMDDVGTMGIKTKAVLRLFPIPPCKARRNYILLENDYEIMSKTMRKLMAVVGSGMSDCMGNTRTGILGRYMMAKNKPKTPPNITGPVILIGLEANDMRILDVYLEQVAEIMKDIARPFEFSEIDLDATNMLGNSLDWKFRLKDLFHFFDGGISPIPGVIGLATCHKIPVSNLSMALEKVKEYDNSPAESGEILMLIPNGSLIMVGGVAPAGDNSDANRAKSMELWHAKLRLQAKYGGCHYWLGESISQSIVEAGAYTLEFIKFFKNIKKTLDPNYIFSPKKFHLYSYEDETMENYSKNPL